MALAAEDLTAFGAGPLERTDHVAVGGLVNQGSDEGAVGFGVADGQLPVGRHDPLDEGVGDRGVHDQPAQRRAALTRGARRGEHDAAHCQVEVGRRRDDRGVVAAEFEQDPAEPLGHPRADLPAHSHRTGRAEQCDARIVDQAFADLTPTHDETTHRRRRADVVGGPLGQRLAGQRGQRGELRRLPDHGVAADKGDRGVPRPHRDGEVEGA